MKKRLVNVRLDEEHLRKARMLRQSGVILSDLVREAIDTRFDAALVISAGPKVPATTCVSGCSDQTSIRRRGFNGDRFFVRAIDRRRPLKERVLGVPEDEGGIPNATSHERRDPNAKIVIVELGDFGCSACAAFARETMPAVQRNWSVIKRNEALRVTSGLVDGGGVPGDNLGPTPYDLLAAALGACTTMTVRMYAERKKWPLEEAVVRLQHSKIHAEDEEACETREARLDRLDRLDRELTLVGPLDAAQRDRLLEIAERCPVHRTLSAAVRITTTPHEADVSHATTD